MKSCNQGHYESIKKAIEGAGFVVDKIQKKGKKTVITIFRNGIGEEIADHKESSVNDVIKELK